MLLAILHSLIFLKKKKKESYVHPFLEHDYVCGIHIDCHVLAPEFS